MNTSKTLNTKMIQTRKFGTFGISDGFGQEQKRFAVAALLRSLLLKFYHIVMPTNRNTSFYTIKADQNKKRKQS